MFRKPFKVKSNTQLKTTDRKVLRETFLKTFPTLTETDIDSILPKKEFAFCIKLITANNSFVTVYLVQKRVIVFECDGVLYPSVYLAWKYSNLGVCFTTNSFVTSKLTAGADLMLPGVIRNPNGYGVFQEKQLAFINSNDNKAPMAVGVTEISSAYIGSSQTKGKCVSIYHFHGDKLCSLEDMPVLPMPRLGPPEWLSYSLDSKTDFPPLGSGRGETSARGEATGRSESNGKNETSSRVETNERHETSGVNLTSTSKILTDENREDSNNIDCATGSDTISKVAGTSARIETNETTDEISEAAGTSGIVETNETTEMDGILMNSFLTAIKYSKTLQLPILTSTFYKLEVVPLCPSEKHFDIKKTSFKKVGQFLKHMEKERLIVVKEKKKGVETVESINREHPTFLKFYVDLENRPSKPSTSKDDDSAGPTIVERYVITNTVLPIFGQFGLKKGETIAGPQVRKYITEYIQIHKFQNTENPGLINIHQSPLKLLFKHKDTVTWEELMAKVFSSLQSSYTVTTGQEETVAKGNLKPISLSVETRSGNKIVTLVDNLELYGIRMSQFAKECQCGVGASTSIGKRPGRNYDQLLVQGNQILFVYNLLVDKYKIPKKYVQGLKYAPKQNK